MNMKSTVDRALAKQVGPLPDGHPSVRIGKIGVLLINLGTPDGTDFRSMRRYLQEFLTDSRVIEWPKALWYPILYGIVLNTRPGRVGKAYQEIWNKDRDESYLRTYTRSQAEKLAEALKANDNVVVDWGMKLPPLQTEADLERVNPIAVTDPDLDGGSVLLGDVSQPEAAANPLQARSVRQRLVEEGLPPPARAGRAGSVAPLTPDPRPQATGSLAPLDAGTTLQ